MDGITAAYREVGDNSSRRAINVSYNKQLSGYLVAAFFMPFSGVPDNVHTSSPF